MFCVFFIRRDTSGSTTNLWRITQSSLPPRPFGNVEVKWFYGQVAMEANDGLVS